MLAIDHQLEEAISMLSQPVVTQMRYVSGGRCQCDKVAYSRAGK